MHMQFGWGDSCLFLWSRLTVIVARKRQISSPEMTHSETVEDMYDNTSLQIVVYIPYFFLPELLSRSDNALTFLWHKLLFFLSP